MYSESLGRWRTADLLIGLAYLARREGQEHPVADIAATAEPIGLGHADASEQATVLVRYACSMCYLSVYVSASPMKQSNQVPSKEHVCCMHTLLRDHLPYGVIPTLAVYCQGCRHRLHKRSTIYFGAL